MRISLKNPYISVSDGRYTSYGGNQMRATDKTEQSVGCGVIAALDLLLYLSKYHIHSYELEWNSSLPLQDTIPLPKYLSLVHTLRKKYLPLIPGHGINGLLLSLGLNRYFLKNRLPFYAHWGVPYGKIWNEIRRMLDDDIPVILSIGPNLPLIWQHNKLNFYMMNREGAYIPGPQTHAHYVMITGMDDDWLQISSWGKKYYINRNEYLSYVKKHSARLVSNILCIRKKSHGVS